MARIISPARTGVTVQYARSFAAQTGPDYEFDCTPEGELLNPTTERVARFNACVEGIINGRAVVDEGIITYTHRFVIPAELRCDCGLVLTLSASENDCGRCSALYNNCGQRLSPPAEWEE